MPPALLLYAAAISQAVSPVNNIPHNIFIMALKLFRTYLFPLMLLFVVVLLVFEFYAFIAMHRDRRNFSPKKLVRDHESALCSFSMPKKHFRPSRPPSRIRCPRAIVTAFRRGPLAAHMWLYANVLATSITTGLQPYLPICLKEYLTRVFDNLTIPLLGEIGHCDIPLPESASGVDDWTSPEMSIVVRSGDLYNDMVVKYLPLVAGHFVFNKALRNVAVLHLLRAKGNASRATYIGVYITMTDLVVNQEYDDMFPSVEFFVDAMNHFRKEYTDAVFVVIVDKKSFWASLLKQSDVYIVEERSLTSLGAALSVLSHCNHTVLASSDMAVWGAILSGGKAIVSLCMSEEFNTVIQNYESWNYLINSSQSVNKVLEKRF